MICQRPFAPLQVGDQVVIACLDRSMRFDRSHDFCYCVLTFTPNHVGIYRPYGREGYWFWILRIMKLMTGVHNSGAIHWSERGLQRTAGLVCDHSTVRDYSFIFLFARWLAAIPLHDEYFTNPTGMNMLTIVLSVGQSFLFMIHVVTSFASTYVVCLNCGTIFVYFPFFFLSWWTFVLVDSVMKWAFSALTCM